MPSLFGPTRDEYRASWQKNLAWMTQSQRDAVELELLRWLEKMSGYPIDVDPLLQAVTTMIESRRNG
jgi:hypothetical protein